MCSRCLILPITWPFLSIKCNFWTFLGHGTIEIIDNRGELINWVLRKSSTHWSAGHSTHLWLADKSQTYLFASCLLVHDISSFYFVVLRPLHCKSNIVQLALIGLNYTSLSAKISILILDRFRVKEMLLCCCYWFNSTNSTIAELYLRSWMLSNSCVQ